MATVELWLGLDPAAATTAALEAYAETLERDRQRAVPGATLWLTPTQDAQRAITERLLREGRCRMAPQVMTFDRFAEWLLGRADQPADAVSPVVRRLLVRRIARELQAEGKLAYFSGVVETGGFLDVVESFLSELKRDEIWPEDFQAVLNQVRGVADRDDALHRIYERYQTVLQTNDWYDNEGRFWLARTALVEGKCRQLPDWSMIAVVGFTDFTRPQTEILEALAEQAERVVITLPAEQSSSRPELFTKSTATRVHWRARGANEQWIAPIRESAVFRQPLQQQLFGPPREMVRALHADGLSILAATGPQSEVRAIARRIKQLLQAGTAPGDILVAVRSLTEDGLRWQSALTDSGLPAWVAVGTPLKLRGIVKFLIAVFQAELDDWAFPRLMAVLDSSLVLPADHAEHWFSLVRQTATLLRRLRLPRDRRGILQIVRRTADLPPRMERPHEDAIDEEADDLPVLAQSARTVLEWYDRQTASLRRTHSLNDWVDVLLEFAQALGAVKTSEVAADLDQWQRVLRDAARADERLGGSPALNATQFLAEMRDLLTDEETPTAGEASGAVRIVSMDQARHLDVPHLFLVGLTEASFPKRRGDDCLFSDAERERFVSAGLPIRATAQHQQDELAFFWTLMQRAQISLTLSYAAVDVRGQPSFSSPYVSAVRQVFAASALQPQTEGALDPVPTIDEALTATDVRLAGFQAIRTGHAGWFRTLAGQPATGAMARNVLAAVEMATARFHTGGYTAYEGQLQHPVNLEKLAERFHPRRQFSATEFESYAQCPFRYWLESVLDLKPLPEVDEGTNHLRRGVVVHDVLAELMPTAPQDLEGLTERFQSLVEKRLGRELGETEFQRALTRLEQTLLDRWGEEYAKQWDSLRHERVEQTETDWTIVKTEFPFGDVPGPQGPQPAAPPLQLQHGEATVFVRGRIDRIDTATIGDHAAFTVIDYKTGRRPSFSQKDIQSGRAVQLLLYALAVQRLGLVAADAVPFQLGYWCLKETGFAAEKLERRKKSTAIDQAAWDVLVQMLEELLPRLASGMRAGEFPVDNPDEHCMSRCDYRTLCRVNQTRSVQQPLQKHRHLSRAAEVDDSSP